MPPCSFAEEAVVAEDLKTRELLELAARVAQCDATVMICGESGTGKEVFARYIHRHSTRRDGAFIALNCAAIPENMLEAVLFGHEKGAFTSAYQSAPGKFEQAQGGTLLLDEISEMSLPLQAKLLRVLQEREVERVGGRKLIQLDVRVLATTNRNLREEVAAGRFREDLYYRLNVVSIWLQPLRERRQDILLLAQHFMQKFSADMGRETPHLSEAAREVLLRYEWPGNVRELQNVVQRLLFTGERELGRSEVEIALGWLHRDRAAKDPNGIDFTNPDKILPLREVEKRFREKYFRFVRDHAGSDAEAARLLGLAPPNYHRMCKELGLK